MKRKTKKPLSLLGVAAVVASLALAGCASDEDGGGGLPELTAAPVLGQTSITSGTVVPNTTAIDVTLSVDADTGGAYVMIGYNDVDDTFWVEAQGQKIVAAANQTIVVPAVFYKQPTLGKTPYFVEVMLCDVGETDCHLFTNTAGIHTAYQQSGATYVRIDMKTLTFADTGWQLATLTVN